MKRISYILFATIVALGLLLPTGVLAAKDTETPCRVGAAKNCLEKENAQYCDCRNDARQNQLMFVKRGQPEWVQVDSARSGVDSCSSFEIVSSITARRYFAGPKVGWITVPAKVLLCRACR